MAKTHSVTSLPEAPEVERRKRIIIYSISMSIRFVCVALIVFTGGIWQWIFGFGAIFLPYFAVVVANNVGGESGRQSNHQTANLNMIQSKDSPDERK